MRKLYLVGEISWGIVISKCRGDRCSGVRVFNDADRHDSSFFDLFWRGVDADHSLALGLARLVAVRLHADGLTLSR